MSTIEIWRKVNRNYNVVCLFLILLPVWSINTSSQSKFSATAGWGYYELVNIGAQWNITQISSLSAYAGGNMGPKEKQLWSAGLSFDQTFLKAIVWKLRPGYSLGMLYWTSNDDLYTFKNLAFPFMALLAYPISNAVIVKAEGGMILNAVLESERKQNVEAGFPDRVNGNVKLSIIYKFGVK